MKFVSIETDSQLKSEYIELCESAASFVGPMTTVCESSNVG